MTTIHIADTGVFAAIGGPTNERYRRVRTFAHRNHITFVLPKRVYDELTANSSSEEPPVDIAIADEWVTIAAQLDYTNPLVSRVMDGVQRYIANVDGRPEDEIERADAALGGVVAQALSTDAASRAYLYTTDVAAGEGVETVLESEGYGDSVIYVNGFRFIEDLLDNSRR